MKVAFFRADKKLAARRVLFRSGWVLCAVSVFLILFSVIRWEQVKNGEGYRLITEGTTVVGIEVNTDEEITVTVPEGITEIGSSAFADTVNLVSVSLPDTLKVIGSGAFVRCYALGEISIPDSVEILGDVAFYKCDALSEAELHGYWKTLSDIFSADERTEEEKIDFLKKPKKVDAVRLREPPKQ